jgi:crotonobetainyl-CoA:carnitine CoA-transferase CaiB-like acyl-CoA transferase
VLRIESSLDVVAPTSPLGGVTVIDFTSYLTGPWATCLLADQGARVVKVEPIGAGDQLRSMGTMRAGMSAVFAVANRNKESIALDLKSTTARDIAQRLVAGADVVAENFRPGVSERLGLDYAACRAVNADIVHLSISGYGERGPYAQLPTFDSVVQAHSGMCYAQGNDATPEFVRQAVCDKVTALYAAQAVTAALFARAEDKAGDR